MTQLTIRGIQEAQRWNLRAIAAMQPDGQFGRAIQYATTIVHRHAVSITHVDTGALRASHRIQLDGLRGRIYIDPSSVNPDSGARPAVYGAIEEARGGSHAFYRRTVNETQNFIYQRLGIMIQRGVE